MAAEAALPVRQLGDPVLRAHCSPIEMLDGELAATAARLQATLQAFRAAHGFGRGIAAPQIGVPRRMVALDLGATEYPDGGSGPLLLLDPAIVWASDETFTLWDDCMSFPSLLVRVRRHASVSVAFRDGSGRDRVWQCVEPALAELLQHELDHLDGVLALDRAEPAAAGLDAVIARAALADAPDRFRAQVDYEIGRGLLTSAERGRAG
jgi:peptide deformylase